MSTSRTSRRFRRTFAALTAAMVTAVVPAAQAFASVPSPTNSTAVITAKVYQDRDSDGNAAPAVGATLTLWNGALSAPVAEAVAIDEPWAICTVDADGDCSFIIPSDAVTQNSDYWVVPEAGPAYAQRTSFYSVTSGMTHRTNSIVVPRENPEISKMCRTLTVALIVDLSGSMNDPDGLPLAELKAAATGMVDALAGTPASIALFTFATTAPADNYDNANRPLTSVETQAGADQVKAWINGWSAFGGTNWDAGLKQVATDSNQYDLAIFITDGVVPSATDSMLSANSIKAKGTRLIAIGIGDSSVSETVAALFAAISGPTADSDYFQTDWPDLAATLSTLAVGACPQIVATPALDIAKQADWPTGAQPGSQVTYTVTVKNSGKVDFTDDSPVTVTDDLTGVLDDADYTGGATASAGSAPAAAGSTLTWVGPLAVGDSVVLTIPVTLKAGGDMDVTNKACVIGAGVNEICDTVSNSFTVPVAAPPTVESTLVDTGGTLASPTSGAAVLAGLAVLVGLSAGISFATTRRSRRP